MRPLASLAAAVVLLGAAAPTAWAQQASPVPFETLARGRDGPTTPRAVVVRSAQELRDQGLERLVPAGARVDWAREMVVAVLSGTRAPAQGSIEVASIERQGGAARPAGGAGTPGAGAPRAGGRLVVTLRASRSAGGPLQPAGTPGGGAPAAGNAPFHLVKLQAFADAVDFAGDVPSPPPATPPPATPPPPSRPPATPPPPSRPPPPAPRGAAAAEARYEESLAVRPPGHRRVLLEAAQGGSLRALARMITLGLWDEMGQLDPHAPAVAAWRDRPGEAEGMTAAQIWGDVLANWAVRRRGELTREQIEAYKLEARRLLDSAPVEHPMLCNELAWLYEDCQPLDRERTARLREGLVARFEASAQGKEPLARAALLLEAARFTLGTDPERAFAIAGTAAESFRAGNDVGGQGLAVHMQGNAADPFFNPGGSYARAIPLYEQAAALGGEAGERRAQAFSLTSLGYCLQPNLNPGGSWARATAVHEQAAALWGAVGDRPRQGRALYDQAVCTSPHQDPAGGDWGRTAALAEQATGLLRDAPAAGGRANLVRSLLLWAVAQARGDATAITGAVRARLEEALAIAQQDGLGEDAATIRNWLQ